MLGKNRVFVTADMTATHVTSRHFERKVEGHEPQDLLP